MTLGKRWGAGTWFTVLGAAAVFAGCPDDGPGPGDANPADIIQDVDDGADALPDVIDDAGDIGDGDDTDAAELPDDGGPQPFCEAGERYCAAPNTVALCGDDGLSWTPEELCGGSTACDPTTAQCMPKVCEPDSSVCSDSVTLITCNETGTGYGGEPTPCEAAQSCVEGQGCVDWYCEPESPWCGDDGGLYTCGSNGLILLGSVPACETPPCAFCREGAATSCPGDGTQKLTSFTECPEAHSCVAGSGCLAWVCTPGENGCLATGAPAVCAVDGFSWIALPGFEGCSGPDCEQCVGVADYIECTAGETGPAATKTCEAGTSCVPNKGCSSWICTPNESECDGKVFRKCAIDGLSWNQVSCNKYSTCVAAGPDAGCDGGDPVGSKMLLDCADLPPLGDGSWIPPVDPSVLKVTFNVGAVPDDKTAFVNLSPLINPLTGGYITELSPVVTVDGVKSGNITVYEDGIPVDVQCIPLLNSDFALVDVVFLLDVTGSMGGTIEKVKTSTIQLAQFLAEKGQDARFGIIPYDDYVPAKDGGASVGGGPPQVLPLIFDAESLESWVEQIISANGGGDGPENGLDAVDWAVNGPPKVDGVPAGPEMAWRKGAQRAIVIMTDISMHHKDDGTNYTHVTLVDMLASLKGKAIVHTISNNIGSTPFPNGTHVDPRVLSCATGGTAASLQTFNQEAIEKALFAKAISQSYSCYFESSDQAAAHDVTVTIDYPESGISMTGSTTQSEVTYID